MKVRIVQLLCPQRHCIVATAYESVDGNAEPQASFRLGEMFADMVKRGANPWCGLCKSGGLALEDAPTKWATLEEALPALKEEERKQAATREMLRAGRN